ncbi:hypothetical protein ACLBR5_16980 [Escherichia coli]
MLADGAFFSGTIPPWLAEENTNANIQGLIDEQRNTTGIVPGVAIWSSNGAVMKLATGVLFCTLPMEDGCTNPGRWRLPGEYMPYGALTRLWSPVMTALLRAFLTLMVNCPTPRFFCLNHKVAANCPRGGRQLVLFAARFRECAARALSMPGRTPAIAPRFGKRLRASQLLEIAQGYPDFPVILEP